MKTILLNWMPPSLVEMPSPAMSVLKQYLCVNGYDVKIEYWNFKLNKLENDFVWNCEKRDRQEMLSMLLYCNYLSFKFEDTAAKSKIKGVLSGIRPSILSADPYYLDRHMQIYYTKLDEYLEEEIGNFKWEDILYVGFSAKLYQWIPSAIIAGKIKAVSPQTIILLGGMGTKEAAIEYLENFNQFDFATWGEGEYVLKQFSNIVSKKINALELYNIPHLAFRTNDSIYVSKKPLNEFVDLNDPEYYPSFTDYISQKEKYNIKQTSYLFVEASRGCHWRKCHFCYLNNGYRHRNKDVNKIVDYIETTIIKYHIYNLVFLDNDLVSNDFIRFDVFLDKLIKIKNSHPEFNIILAEIITKGFTEKVIRKMSLAGFSCVQIGYESPSDKLLAKIDKKNTFASNLLFLKFAYKYKIRVNGMNVICGLVEETDEDIVEAIENLRYMRFLLGDFKHNMSKLAIMGASKYFNKLKENNSFVLTNIYDLLPSKIITNNILNNCNIVEKVRLGGNSLWKEFIIVDKYYHENDFRYKIFDNDNFIIYQEFLNNGKINEIEIDKSSLDYFILERANSEVILLTEPVGGINSS